MIYHVILYIFTTLSKQKNWPNWPSILDVMKTHHHTTRCQQRTPNAIHFPQVQRGGKATNRNIERNTSENVRTAAVHENRWSRIAKWWIAERRFPISQAISPNLPKSNSKKCWWHAQGTTYAWGWFNWHNLTTFMYKNVKRTFPNRSIINIRIYDHAYILSYYIYNIIYDELYHDSIENLQPTFELCWQASSTRPVRRSNTAFTDPPTPKPIDWNTCDLWSGYCDQQRYTWQLGHDFAPTVNRN